MTRTQHKYRKVSTKIWTDGAFGVLNDAARLLFLYLLTHPHQTKLGAFRATVEGLGAEMRWTPKKFNTHLTALIQSGLVCYDKPGACVYLPRFIRHNLPENPNVIKSWSVALADIPDCELKAVIIRRTEEEVQTLSKGLRAALPVEFRNEERKPEPEPEPEPEPKKNIKKKAAVLDDLPVEPVSLSAFEHWVAEWTTKYDEPPTVSPKHFGDIERLEANLGRPALKTRIDRCLQSQDPFWTAKRHPVGLFVAQVDQFAPTPAEKPTGARQRDPANYGRKVLRAES